MSPFSTLLHDGWMRAAHAAAMGLVLAALAPAALAVPSADGAVSEYQVKGTYLFNFIRLVEWPAAGAHAQAPLPVCVLGESAIVPTLESLSTTPVRGRRLMVRRVTLKDAAGCEVLFISARATADVDSVVRATPRGVLTVSEIDTDDPVATVINFVVEQDRVGFDVSTEAARRAQLSVDTRLLNVARAVDGRRRRKE